MPTTFPWLFCTCSKTSNLFHNHDIRSRYAPIRSSYDELMIIMLCGHCHTIWPKSKVVTRMWTGIMGAKNINKTYKVFDCHLVSIPIAIFRSNSKCDQHLQCFGLGYTPPIIMKFCTQLPWLHSCDVCKISLWLVKHILNKSTPNFDHISNWIQIPLVGRAPGQFYQCPTDVLAWHMSNIYCMRLQKYTVIPLI